MRASPKDQFEKIVDAAQRAVPGGEFNRADLKGLHRRADSLCLDPVVRDDVLADRPRHRATSIGE